MRGDLKKESAVGKTFLVEGPAKASLWLDVEGPWLMHEGQEWDATQMSKEPGYI